MNESVKLTDLISWSLPKSLENQASWLMAWGLYLVSSLRLAYQQVSPSHSQKLARLTGWHPEKNPDGFLLGGPQRPGEGTCCASKAILCKAASLRGKQVLCVTARSHGDVKHEPICPPLTPWGTAFHRFLGVKASYTKSSWGWCSSPRQSGLSQVLVLKCHPPAGWHFGTGNQPSSRALWGFPRGSPTEPHHLQSVGASESEKK